MKSFLAILFFFSAQLTLAQSFTATVVAVRGDVKVLTESKDNMNKALPQLKFEGKVYSFIKPKMGTKLNPHDMVHTGPDGQLKGIYVNGDQLLVGNGTAFVMPVPLDRNGAKRGSHLDLVYGKVRAMVSKDGPLTDMKVKTPTALAGVRGTDFFVSHAGGEGTEVTVLRGAVSVSSNQKPASSLVQQGESAAIASAKENSLKKDSKPEIKVVSATKEKLLEVQITTHLKTREDEVKALPESEKKAVENLEAKATQSILQDIQTNDPKLFEKIKGKSVASAADINSVVVSELYKEAPMQKPSKPSQQEIEALDKDVYEKYFKTE